jgi:hypothetical protein
MRASLAMTSFTTKVTKEHEEIKPKHLLCLALRVVSAPCGEL